jgi:hypothetical protein
MHGIERMRLFRAIALVGGAFILLVHAAGATGVSPCAVVDSYERAWAHGDFEGALAQLADGAVLTVHDPRARALSTRLQITEFLQYAAIRGVPILTAPCQVAGSTVTWSERPDSEAMNVNEVTAQAVVLNGKIQSLVYRPGRVVQTPSAPTLADKIASESAGLHLAALVLLGLGLLSLATVIPHGHSDSNLRGRLLRELRHWRPSAHQQPPS